MALGAAVAQATIGRRIGRRAILLGAVLGTLPDLDVLIRYADAVDSFTRHRGFSHSLFVLSLVSLPLGVLLRRLLDRGGQASAGLWWFATWAVLITHALLDGFTGYGTQLFWPLPVPPVGIASIFIIDPLYTVPLLVGLVLAWRWGGHQGRRGQPGQSAERGQRANMIGLVLAQSWLMCTLVLQQVAQTQAMAALHEQSLETQSIKVLPFPLGVLWRVVATDGDDVLEGWISLIDERDDIRFDRIPRDLAQLEELALYPPVQRLRWFTQDLVSVRMIDDALVMTDLRIGTAAQPVFAFDVAERVSGEFEPMLTRARQPNITLDDMMWLLQGLGGASIDPPQSGVAGQRRDLAL